MRTAFKEWALVCRALATGRQILILRKGGIIEEGGVFRPDHPQFVLFPTYSHQLLDSVVPDARVDFEELEREMPDAGTIVFRHTAAVSAVVRLDSLEAVHALRGEHIWSDDVVEDRFFRWKDHSVWAMIVRVSALAQPVVVELREEYTGCKSWVSLEEEIPTGTGVPVIPPEEQLRREKAILVRLAGER
ncbi:MAG TPA: DUF1802 family protein [Planctomycetota bacterium]|nr:DUF1802 family protein [Planctomycetota bacterium]